MNELKNLIYQWLKKPLQIIDLKNLINQGLAEKKSLINQPLDFL